MGIELLKILSTKTNWIRFRQFIKDHLLSPEVRTIVKDMEVYYDLVEEVEWAKFSLWFRTVRHVNYEVDQYEMYEKIFQSLIELGNIDDDTVIKSVMESFIARDYCLDIADKGSKGADGESDAVDMIEDVADVIDKYNEEVDKVSSLDKYFETDDFRLLFDDTNTDGQLVWRTDWFNKAVGPISKGSLIVMAARPEAGKTTWVLSETTHMAEQLPDDKDMLIINNEESGIKARAIQCSLGIDSSKLRSQPVKYMTDYTSLMGRVDKIKVLDKGDVSVSDIEAWLRVNGDTVGLIVINQLWKVHGFNKEGNEVARQAKLFQWARSLAKHYAPVFNVHQADGSAEGSKWLDMGQLYGSKTAIQGEADVLVMMGMTHDTGYEYNRYFSLCKNKLQGCKDETLRHGKHEMLIKPEIGRFIL